MFKATLIACSLVYEPKLLLIFATQLSITPLCQKAKTFLMACRYLSPNLLHLPTQPRKKTGKPSTKNHKYPWQNCCYSNLSPSLIQSSFDAKSLCILHSDFAKTSSYSNRWSSDNSLAGACCIHPLEITFQIFICQGNSFQKQPLTVAMIHESLNSKHHEMIKGLHPNKPLGNTIPSVHKAGTNRQLLVTKTPLKSQPDSYSDSGESSVPIKAIGFVCFCKVLSAIVIMDTFFLGSGASHHISTTLLSAEILDGTCNIRIGSDPQFHSAATPFPLPSNKALKKLFPGIRANPLKWVKITSTAVPWHNTSGNSSGKPHTNSGNTGHSTQPRLICLDAWPFLMFPRASNWHVLLSGGKVEHCKNMEFHVADFPGVSTFSPTNSSSQFDPLSAEKFQELQADVTSVVKAEDDSPVGENPVKSQRRLQDHNIIPSLCPSPRLRVKCS
ncbi:hypothetical protein VP01_1910g1 [Puccinia sorghi]|uniref:Uncharacterized protein n=1 Tax=Puccinia sorghi TaxID=27349 RepID=A0A0L6VCN1_9BASI|nr:hypothetical protein VP01_1910g1 [Puccinia sorghi]